MSEAKKRKKNHKHMVELKGAHHHCLAFSFLFGLVSLESNISFSVYLTLTASVGGVLCENTHLIKNPLLKIIVSIPVENKQGYSLRAGRVICPK